MIYRFAIAAVAILSAWGVPTAAQPDAHETAAISTIHLTSRTFLEDDELDASGSNRSNYAAARLGPAATMLRRS